MREDGREGGRSPEDDAEEEWIAGGAPVIAEEACCCCETSDEATAGFPPLAPPDFLSTIECSSGCFFEFSPFLETGAKYDLTAFIVEGVRQDNSLTTTSEDVVYILSPLSTDHNKKENLDRKRFEAVLA